MRRGDRRDRRDLRPRHGQGHGLALAEDPRPGRRQGRERARRPGASPRPTSPPTTAARTDTAPCDTTDADPARHALARFTRSDADAPRRSRAVILILVLTAILGADILPAADARPGGRRPRPRDIVAPARARLRERDPDRSRRARPPARTSRRSTTTRRTKADRHRRRAADRLRRSASPGSTPPSPPSSRPTSARALLEDGRPRPHRRRAERRSLGARRRALGAVRTEAARVLDATLRTELRDTEVAETRTRLAGRMAGGLDEAERMLAAELIAPLVVANSSFSQEPDRRRRRPPRPRSSRSMVSIRQGEVVVRSGERLDAR